MLEITSVNLSKDPVKISETFIISISITEITALWNDTKNKTWSNLKGATWQKVKLKDF